MVYYLSFRKFVVPFGFMCLGSVIALTYKFLITYKIIYVMCDVGAVGISAFILFPFFRNQVVEIMDDSITTHRYWKRINLTIDNLEMIRRGKEGTTSYHFLKDGRCYIVTPDLYTNSENMLKEFTRTFDSHNKHIKRNLHD